MGKKELVKSEENEYERYLNDKSVLELVSVLKYLDEEKPYAELLENGSIGEFIKKREYKSIPINNMKEFNSFYELLEKRIAETGDEKKMNLFLEQANYQRELKELPNLMNKLERINFDKLEPKFRAVMEYVYDAVMNRGFEMNRDVTQRDVADIYSTQNKKVHLKLWGEIYNSTEFILFKERKEGSNFRIELKELCGKSVKLKLKNLGEITKYFNDYLSNADEGEIKKFTYQIKNLLSLPTTMNKYFKERISTLEGCLKDINSE